MTDKTANEKTRIRREHKSVKPRNNYSLVKSLKKKNQERMSKVEIQRLKTSQTGRNGGKNKLIRHWMKLGKRKEEVTEEIISKQKINK